MITHVHIENYRCFDSFDIDLGKFNVLIGPNDSGKSAFLTSLMVPFALSDLVQTRGTTVVFDDVFGAPRGLDFPPKERNAVTFGAPDDALHGAITRHYRRRESGLGQECVIGYTANGGGESEAQMQLLFRLRENSTCIGLLGSMPRGKLPQDNARHFAGTVLGPTAYCNWSASNLKMPSKISELNVARQEETLSPTGVGLATFLDDFLRADRESFRSMEEEFYRRYPQYDPIKVDRARGGDLPDIPHPFDGPGNQLTFGKELQLPAKNISDGAILYLAYLAVTHQPDPPNLLLIEEPENGIHYAALQEIVNALRDLSERRDVQIVMTTHSPYLLDLVEPEDVRVFSKSKETDTVKAAKLSDFPQVEEMRKHFMTGEIWTTFEDEQIVKSAMKKSRT